MRDTLGTGTILGYCTNVHGGETFGEVTDNLRRYTCALKNRVCPGEMMGVGLWLSARAASEILEGDRVEGFREELGELGLLPFTLNGFPYGDFHRDVVKHDVYRPDWRDERRGRYTIELAQILARLLPEGGEGSISTLPLGWKDDLNEEADFDLCAGNLFRVSEALHRLEEEHGRLIHLDLEPEPGCALECSLDVVGFFDQHLSRLGDSDRLRRHLRVCHDICHEAVMFEDQTEVLERYRRAGILVGKVQISAALKVKLAGPGDESRVAALDRLRCFSEERYLHQTTVRDDSTASPRFYEDLPQALAAASKGLSAKEEWRVHFHVPIHAECFGPIQTTSDEIISCLNSLNEGEVSHFEIETYAWNVLPPDIRGEDLVEGMAREVAWLRQRIVSAEGA